MPAYPTSALCLFYIFLASMKPGVPIMANGQPRRADSAWGRPGARSWWTTGSTGGAAG